MTALCLSIRTDEFDYTAAYKPNANGKAEEDEDESLIDLITQRHISPTRMSRLTNELEEDQDSSDWDSDTCS